MAKNAKPTPVAVTTVCSLCGLDWHQHGADPTTEDCIRLLKAELARRPVTINVRPPIWVQPYPVQPIGPIWSSPTITCGDTKVIQYTPRRAEITCSAVT